MLPSNSEKIVRLTSCHAALMLMSNYMLSTMLYTMSIKLESVGINKLDEFYITRKRTVSGKNY